MAVAPRITLHSILGKFGGSNAHKKGPRPVWRSSDDFWPDIPVTNPWHVYQNAMAGMVLGSFSGEVVLDWDMFQSAHPFAQYHALARAISGGPVYISDVPGKHNPKILKPLYFSQTGRVLRFHQNARISHDTLFAQVTKGGSASALVKITNVGTEGRGEGVGVVAAFGCQGDESVVSGTVGVEDVVGLEGKEGE
ncbi:hypothetical protein HK097_005783, partial [Rhizophlyctis rosea]